MRSAPRDQQTRWRLSSPSRYCSLKRLARYTCATQTIQVRITTQTFRRSVWKQHTQPASSNKIHLWRPTSTNQHTISQHRHTARTTTHHCPALDIVGEVTLKTSVDGYQLLKVNKMIKNAVAWRVRMPKASKFSKYFNDNSKDGTKNTPEPKVHINKAMLEVMGQAAKDFGYTEQEFVEAVEMYQYFGNQNLEDVPIPNSQD